MRFFVNMPLSWIADDRSWLDKMTAMGIRPELGLDARAMDEQGEAWHRDVAAELHRALGADGPVCSIHLPFIDLVPGSPDAHMRRASLERLVRALDLAALYQPALCIAHAAFSPVMYADQEDAWLDASAATWQALHAARPDHPPVFLENVFETDPMLLTRLAERLPAQRFGLCLDVGHWHSFGNGCAAPMDTGGPAADLTRWLDAFAPHLGHLHLHDNDGSFDQHLGLGRGIIPLETLFQGLAQRGLSPSATLEPHSEADFRASLAWLDDRPGLLAPPGA